MTKDGSRFLFSFVEPIRGEYQFCIADLNPVSMGGSPTLSNIIMDPQGAVPSGQSSAMQVTVTPANGSDSVRYAGNVALRNGLQRSSDVISLSFYDDGVNAGDVTADDNIFTHNNVFAYSTAELGNYTMRFNCEVYDADYRLQGTAVEIYPFGIVSDINHLGIGDPDMEGGFGIYPVRPIPVRGETTFGYHLNDNGNSDGQLWYPVETELGSLQSPHVHDRELTCVVCTK